MTVRSENAGVETLTLSEKHRVFKGFEVVLITHGVHIDLLYQKWLYLKRLWHVLLRVC